VIYDVDINGRTRRIEIRRRDGALSATVDGRPQYVDIAFVGGVCSLILESEEGRRSYEIAVDRRTGGDLGVYVNGRLAEANVTSGRGAWGRGGAKGADTKGPQRVAAPMPGRVVKVLVAAGESVAKGQGLVVVEAMKMENELRATRAGVVSEIRVQEGAPVEAGTVLVIVE
jgi:biotin carboxyl carrier protein